MMKTPSPRSRKILDSQLLVSSFNSYWRDLFSYAVIMNAYISRMLSETHSYHYSVITKKFEISYILVVANI